MTTSKKSAGKAVQKRAAPKTKARSPRARRLRKDIAEVLSESQRPTRKAVSEQVASREKQKTAKDAFVNQERRPARRISPREFIHRKMREMDEKS